MYPDPRLSHAVALLPPCWFLSYILAALFHRFLVPTSVKNRLRILTQDSVTLDNLPEEPTPRMVVRWKAVLSTVLAAARLAMAVVLLVRLQTTHTDRDVLTLIQRSLAVSAWVSLLGDECQQRLLNASVHTDHRYDLPPPATQRHPGLRHALVLHPRHPCSRLLASHHVFFPPSKPFHNTRRSMLVTLHLPRPDHRLATHNEPCRVCQHGNSEGHTNMQPGLT